MTCPCGKANESRTHVVGECEMYKEEPDVLEMRKIDGCDMEYFGTLGNYLAASKLSLS